MKQINLAQIGCGYWGPNLLRNVRLLPDCFAKIACDSRKDRLAHMKSLYREIDTTTEFDQVVDDGEIDRIGWRRSPICGRSVWRSLGLRWAVEYGVGASSVC